MADIVTATELAEHLNLPEGQDVGLLTRKIASAQSLIEQLLGYQIATEYPDDVPPALVEAVSLLAGHFYENREASVVGVAAQPIPFGVQDIVREFRSYSFGE
jgi:hypothetical protein